MSYKNSGAGSSETAAVSNHMVGAILTTVFCCLVGGIISIVYASKVNSRLAQGDVDGARAASKTAKLWIIINIVAAPLAGLLLFLVGSIGMGALAPAVSNAQSTANASAAAMRGRNLFVAMTQACVDREARGLEGVWPHRDSAVLSDDADDISGITFSNSTDYFKKLFDVASKGRANWAPYVDVDDGVLKLSSGRGFCDWIVAADIEPDFDDVIPVLVSANVDPYALKTSFDGHDNSPVRFGSRAGRTRLPWCDKFVVVIRKSGESDVIKARDLTYSRLYKNQSFSAPGLTYLDVE